MSTTRVIGERIIYRVVLLVIGNVVRLQFVYVQQAFAPSLDQDINTLYEVFKKSLMINIRSCDYSVMEPMIS